MLREFLKTREFLIGFTFCVMVVLGSGIYVWYTISMTDTLPPETHRLKNNDDSTPIVSIHRVDFETSQPQIDAIDGTTEDTQSTTETQEGNLIQSEKAPVPATDVSIPDPTEKQIDVSSVQDTEETVSDDGQQISPAERKKAGEIIEAFLRTPADMEIPISELDPSLVAEIREMGVTLDGLAKLFIHTPQEVREAQRILSEDP